MTELTHATATPFQKAGYTKVYFDYINTIFIRSDILESKGNFFQDKDWKIR